jgi:acyl CoA:acetate/3-ketoacid CoA transferase alpha subunit
MDMLSGQSELFCPYSSPDEMREYFAKKSRVLTDKRMTVKEAVSRFVNDGDYLAIGCFGHIRIPMAVEYEIIRQKKRNLGFAGHTGVHDLDILLAGGCIDRVDVAYSFGHEFRPGRSKVADRLIKAGKLKTAEWTNATFSWRYKAAAMGLSFIPIKSMLGTDTFKWSAAKTVTCPFSGELNVALPALYPDVVLIHVPRADKHGNCQIDGITMADYDLARAAKKLIITTEEIVDESVIRAKPDATVIPYYLVDAVCEVPYGSHPCEMPYLYWFDEEHIAEYLNATKTEETLQAYLDKYVFGVDNFEEYLEVCGGIKKINKLRRIANMEEMPS